MTEAGGRIASSQLPLIQPLTSPIRVPTTKARTVVTPTSPSVQGKAASTIVLTGVPKLVVKEMPKLKVSTCFQ